MTALNFLIYKNDTLGPQGEVELLLFRGFSVLITWAKPRGIHAIKGKFYVDDKIEALLSMTYY